MIHLIQSYKEATTMKPYLQLVLFTFLIIKTIVSNPKENLRYLSETHFEFAIELYNEVAKSRSGNLVIAGHSVNVGMAMLFLGTTAKTKSSYELRIGSFLVLCIIRYLLDYIISKSS